MLRKWILSIILNAVAIIAVAELFDAVEIEHFGYALIAAFILSILNVVVKPIILIFTLPITIFTLGLFLFVVNAITLMLAQWMMGDTFIIDGFGWAILAALIISLLNMLLERLVKDIVN
ncbi:phage holin family protein [Allobacillus sp. GCM10007491]|uniref:Phage holin family protein n=1 Tax=Allobacillus saliphilus TaxID=2912308 RepID=A0A941CS56_9BACI|nr:phage holin family protein [Allobacillus saliphilus]MBR7552709.1 phage holin family protein [Allobacillus saliphilus]